MTFLVLFSALLAEQLRPLRQGNPVHAAYARFARYLQQQFDAGEQRQGVVAWLLAVAPLTLAVLIALWLASQLNQTLAWLMSVAVLYVCMGLRLPGDFLNKINNLLAIGEVSAAREQLRAWRNEDCDELNSGAIARLAIEQGLLSSHRQLFAPMAWFLVAGPAGASRCARSRSSIGCRRA